MSSSSCCGSPVCTTLATTSVGARSSLLASGPAHPFSRSRASGPSTRKRHGLVRWWFGAVDLVRAASPDRLVQFHAPDATGLQGVLCHQSLHTERLVVVSASHLPP